MIVSRNSFARYELHKESAGTGECDWCGSEKKLYHYYIEPDRIAYKRDEIKGNFCCVGCMRSYHS